MKFRQFIRQMQKEQREATPAFSSMRLSAAPARKRSPWKLVSAGVSLATAAALCLTVTLTHMQPDLPLSPVVQVEVPEWYAPQELNMVSMSYEAGNLSVGEFSPLEDIGLNCVRVELEEDRQGYYYLDMEKSEIVDVSKMAAASLRKIDASAEDQTPVVLQYTPAQQRALVANRVGGRLCVLDMKNNVSVETSVSGIVYSTAISADGDHALVVTESVVGQPKVYLLNLNKGTSIVLNALSTTQDYLFDSDAGVVRFSDSGRYAIYSILDENGFSSAGISGNWLVYDTVTGQSITVNGEILRFSENDEAMLVESLFDGIYWLNCATGEKMPASEETDRYRVLKFYDYEKQGYYLYRYDGMSKECEPISDRAISAYALSDDQQYAFYYAAGDDAVMCMEISTRRAFSIPVTQQFQQEAAATYEKDEYREYGPRYSLYYDEQKKEVALLFTEAEVLPNGNNTTMEMLSGRKSVNLYSWLTGAERLVDRYADIFTYYQGDGYYYLTAEADGQVLVKVTDMRTGLQEDYIYQAGNMEQTLTLVYSMEYEDDGGLLDALLESRGIEMQPAQIDFSTLSATDGRPEYLQ